ncbi:guanine nucleotide binding protein alpha subunit [Aureococcus anophagefferens]|uniref:Guanine nucleotide binding protein alpha subunit n=1 Tax=Aureococcus anophagefferens TaxID=44056 RepID=A0ABR1FSN7_AURAN
MGTCASSEAQREAMLIDKMMEEELKKASVADEALVKLLILGAGESGKSTLFKQMKLMRGSRGRGRRGARARRGGAARAPPAPARRGRPTAGTARPSRARSSTTCAAAAPRRRGRPRRDAARARRRDVIYENTLVAMQTLAANLPNFDIDIEVVDKAALATVLEPTRTRRSAASSASAWKLRGHVQIVESVVYFFEKIAELKRATTHGIVTSKYTIKGKDYEMYDVGGQRNERRKFEDETTNRMKDALDLFEEVCDNRHFSNVEANGFPDYAGKANDYADGVRYFTDKFLRKNKDPERTIFCHVRAVMDMCYHVITQKKLESIGFM